LARGIVSVEVHLWDFASSPVLIAEGGNWPSWSLDNSHIVNEAGGPILVKKNLATGVTTTLERDGRHADWKHSDCPGALRAVE
jgi:hypothetical protein